MHSSTGGAACLLLRWAATAISWPSCRLQALAVWEAMYTEDVSNDCQLASCPDVPAAVPDCCLSCRSCGSS